VKVAAIGIVFVVLAGACGGGSDDRKVEIGLQRIALDLAFKADQEAEEKPQPEQTVLPTVIPSQAEFAVSIPVATFDQPFPERAALPERPVAAPACPAAVNALPERAVTTFVSQPPREGTYKVHRTGTFAIESAVFPFQGNMPAKGEKEYRNVKVIAGTTDVLGNKAPDQYEYEVLERTGDNSTSRTLRVTPTAIQLVKQVTTVGGSTVSFSPTPAITLVALGTGENDSWNSAGIDTATGTSMVVQGKIAKRENVDLCGTVYDTFVVQSTERITNVLDRYTSQTDDAATAATAPTGGEAGKPNTYWVATQFGGLFIQEDFHTTTTLTVDVAGAPVPVTLKLDYTNTFDSIDPAGPPSAP
jgi:hypothetical protein